MKRWLMRLALTLVLSVGLALVVVASLVRPDLPSEPLIERYTSEQSQWFEVDGLRVHFRDQGNPNGPPMLLLHGTFASLHTWEAWVSELGETYRIITLDLPGFGLTGPHPKKDYSLAATLHLFESLREHLGISEWVVAGNSLGAGYALAYAQHQPDAILAVGLLNGGRIRLSQADYEAQRASVEASQARERGDSLVAQALRQPQARALLTQITPRFLVRYALKDVYGDPAQISDAQVTRYHELLRRAGNRQAFIDRFERQGDPSLSPYALTDPVSPVELEIPILIIWGEKDRWIPLSVGERLASILPNTELKVYPELGHIPMEESPQKTAGDFAQFLVEVGVSNPALLDSSGGDDGQIN